MKSMTGFGNGEVLIDDLLYRVEISSVNRKQADIIINMPRELSALETRVRKMIKESVSRGRVNVNIFVKASSSEGGTINVNKELAKKYYEALRVLELDLGSNNFTDNFDPLRANGVINFGVTLPEVEDAWAHVKLALVQAVDHLIVMRSDEGAHLKADLESRLDKIKANLEKISEYASHVVSRHKENLFKRLTASGLELDLNDERVIKEIGIFADRCDITEEITRLESHFIQSEKYFSSNEAVGRPLDFLVQEISRELNTIGSKANDANIAQSIVETKTELEKIREQVQNVE
jgi:uncharacterized protein (TIGR00255 family)